MSTLSEPDERVERMARLVGLVLEGRCPSASRWSRFREDIDRSTVALILVLPVVLVAVVGGLGPAALAAGTASLSLDVLLIRPITSSSSTPPRTLRRR